MKRDKIDTDVQELTMVIAHDTVDVASLREDFDIRVVGENDLLNTAILTMVTESCQAERITVLDKAAMVLFVELVNLFLTSNTEVIKVLPLINSEADIALYADITSSKIILDTPKTPMAFLRARESDSLSDGSSKKGNVETQNDNQDADSGELQIEEGDQENEQD